MASRESSPDNRYACPCCGFGSLDGIAEYDICPICFWEDDGQDDENADEIFGGPNGSYSLTDARRNFLTIGASRPQDLKHVRPEEAIGMIRLREYGIVDQTVRRLR